ncbi:Two-component response receiver and regulator protein [Desulfamplus magnetovallimortis]|uniref:Two-component response receiver and regulator protein n=1 Tax=Desulfamplus magnetovallimortis TaxID=1246637 RepID=A0A1W1H6K0_9BACT|nr:response regulator [Desulfamplus magnetovallimortis]SLM28056.1 Two-component response receiver and regulator protein [Desulfamplus magnetovallimortis]
MTKKILVVDDDPAIVKYLVSIFSDNGYATCTANDGAEAFEVLKKETPDLITLDLEMPKEWGPKFFRRISKQEEFKDIPVIVISGLASRHLSIGKAVTWLAKPFDPEKLIEIVKNTIG